MTLTSSHPQEVPRPGPKVLEGSGSQPQNTLNFPSSENQRMSAVPTNNAQSAGTRPGMPQTHTRSSSFFSFLSNKQQPDSALSQRKLSLSGVSPSRAPGTPNPPAQQQPQPLPQQRQQPSTPMQQQPSPPGPGSPNPVSQSPNPHLKGQQPQSPNLLIQSAPLQSAPLHPEIRSVVSLTVAHAHKIYFSGPLIRRIERQPDGQKPTKDDGWTEVWAQLGGTTLSVWDMKEIQEASRQGKEVPPAYVNVTDAFVQVLGSVTVPATATQPSKRYTNVLTLNTAGSNLLLFSCPSTNALISWASALRLSAWEKSRLEEVYTAHLIRITLNRPNAPTTLLRGKMEGWVRIRVAGQTDWKRVWMVVSAGAEGIGAPSVEAPSNGGTLVPSPTPKKKRMSSLFSRDASPPRPTGPSKPIITMYGGQKPKERKKPWLSFRDVTQAFAVYPERPELISRSTLIKLEGLLGDEDMAQSMKSREGWLLFMPEMEGTSGNHAAEMLKWVIAIHDAFEIYGRPEAWTWDPREPTSLMFAYPVGPQRDLLFLDREAIESLDPRDDRTSAIRSRLLELLTDRMRQQQPQLVQQRPSLTGQASSDSAPSLPPISIGSDPTKQQQQNGASPTSPGPLVGPQLPPLNFSGINNPPQMQDRMLTPITEGGSIMTHGRGMSTDNMNFASPVQVVGPSASQPANDNTIPGAPAPILDRGFTNSPEFVSVASPPPVTVIDIRPSTQSVKSSTSMDRPARAASHDSKNHPPTSLSSHSQSHSTKLEIPSIAGVTDKNTPANINDTNTINNVNDAKTANNSAGLLPITPTNAEQLVSPYSPVIENPIRISLSGSTSSDRPKSPGAASFLTSPYSHHDHVPADSMSILTSPHSVHELQQQERSISMAGGDFMALGQVSAELHAASTPAPATGTSNTSGAGVGAGRTPVAAGKKMSSTAGTHEPEDNFLNEAGALYFMHQSRLEGGDAGGPSNKPRQIPMPMSSEDDDDDDDEGDSDSSGEYRKVFSPNAQEGINSARSPPLRQGTPMAFQQVPAGLPNAGGGSQNPTSPRMRPSPPQPTSPRPPGTTPVATVAPLRLNSPSPGGNAAGSGTAASGSGAGPMSTVPSTRAGLGRKPSGARAQATSRMPYNGSGIPPPSHQQQLTEEEETSEDQHSHSMQASTTMSTLPTTVSNGSSAGGGIGSSVPSQSQSKPGFVKSTEVDVEESNEEMLAALSYLNVADDAEEQQQQQRSSNGKGGAPKVDPLKVSSQNRSASGPGIAERPSLSTSSISDSGSGGLQFKSSFAPSTSAAKRKAKAQAQQAAHHAAVHKPGRANGKKKSRGAAGAWNDSSEEEEDEDEDDEDDDEADSDGGPVPARMQGSASGHAASGRPSVYGQLSAEGGQSSQLRSRMLPQPPSGRPGPGVDDHHNLPPRRLAPDQFSDTRRTYYDDGAQTQIRTQSEFPHPGAARQTVWSQVLDPGRNVNPVEQSQQHTRDTFVQLDTAETMTKAFTPQGLLSAGLQDKQDRSAKRQEELARETGASLINVPNKPPPPQTGLLGAITAHERERKREGGVGAALTEREREKRLVEERQRRFDEQQRQQMEQMQQGGSMYGGYGYNPMMNPMMMGMNPMMMNPMMTGGGLSPMMTGGGMNPMMTGGGMSPMMGFPGMLNPQQMFAAQQAAAAAYQQAMMAFSVAGSQNGGEGGREQQQQNIPMGQMGPNMTGNQMPGFDPRMSMMGMPMMGGMGMGGMQGMAPTMSGNFDSRFPPGSGSPSGGVGGDGSGLLPPTGPSQFSSQTGSPVGRGSPSSRPTDAGDRPATPKH